MSVTLENGSRNQELANDLVTTRRVSTGRILDKRSRSAYEIANY